MADPVSAVSPRGLLIVFEGGEGVGKTTQWRRLIDYLEQIGQSVVALREPGGTPPGDVIRALLLESGHDLAPATEALLFAASRAELLSRSVLPALARGDVVVLDRYLLSTYVYQGVARGLPMDGLRSVNQFATGGLVPDLTLLLRLPLNESLVRTRERGAPDRLERETEAFHAKVAAGFDASLAAAWQSQHPECGPIEPVLATGTPDEVAVRCISKLEQRWPERFGHTAARIV